MRIILLFIILFVTFSSHSQERDNQQSSDELLAAQLMNEGNFEKAATIYEELFDKNPTPLIYNNYLRCLIELEDYRRALRVVNSQISNNPGRARFEVDLGYVYTRSGDNRRARRQLEGLINDLRAHPPSVTDLANAFLFRNFTDYALQTYLKGRELIGVAFPFNLQLAEIYQRKGDYANMMNEYVELVVKDDSFLEQVQGLLQDAINNDPGFEKTDALRRILLQGSQRNPSQTLYAELLLWLSIQQKDFVMAFRQARALDRRTAQDGSLVIEVARLSAANQQYDIASQSFGYVVDLGELSPYYLDARVGLLNVKYSQATKGYAIDYDLLREVEAEYLQTLDQLGVRPQTVSLVRNLANLKAFYLNKHDEATEILRAVIDLPNISHRIRGECRVELADILILKGQLWDAHLQYAQVDRMFRDDPLAHEARYKNARLSFYMGEFKWAKAQLDVLKAATSRLMANDAMALSLLIQDNLGADAVSVPLEMYARAELHTFTNNFDLAIQVLDSIQTQFSGHQIIDDVMMTRASIYSRTGKYDQADQLLEQVAARYPRGLHAAEALFRRALLQERIFENKELAMELHTQLMTSYPGSLRNADARSRFRYLRGDINQDELFFYGIEF